MPVSKLLPGLLFEQILLVRDAGAGGREEREERRGRKREGRGDHVTVSMHPSF